MSQIPRDILSFWNEYPNEEDDPSEKRNLQFYQNILRCQPDRLLIDELHERWKDKFDILEAKHGYIQWLFPIREYGMNYDSQPLQPHEIKEMRASEEVMQRILRSYRLMLSFFGMTLLDEQTGLLARSEDEERCLNSGVPLRASRYRNLTVSHHNNLRISRILKCLSEMGLEHLNAGFLLHVLYEQSSENQLKDRHGYLQSSMDRWWANCIRNQEERDFIGMLIMRVRHGELVFTREKYEELLERRQRIGTFLWEEPGSEREEEVPEQ